MDNYPKTYIWVGPRVMSNNGLELHAVVAEDQHGRFQAGTRYGPCGSAMPELGPQEFWCMESHKDRKEAIAAAKADTAQTLQGCNRYAAEARLEKATRPAGKGIGRSLPRSRGRGIDR
jgi:hypothetical protein